MEHLRKIQSAYSKCKEYSDDKVQLAMQTYEMVSHGKMGTFWNGAPGNASQCQLSLTFLVFCLSLSPKQVISPQTYISRPQKAISCGTRLLFCWRISGFIPLGGGFISSTRLLCDNASKFAPLPPPQQLSVTDNLFGVGLS